jgi:cytochrome P450
MRRWQETIDQGQKMLQSWVKDEEEGKSIERVMDDTMRLSLHVISRAGFGRRLEWPTKDAKEKIDQEYNDPSKIRNEEEGIDEGHTMSYTYAIHCLLDNILAQFLLPRWMISRFPSKRLRKANEAFHEWGNYMKEMVENKKLELAQEKKTDNMDLMGQLVRGQLDGQKVRGTSTLTDEEVLGNMFVFILAGHETAANSIHFSLLYLALDTKSQRALQKDLDNIFKGKPPSEWDYDRDLPQLFGGMVGAVMNEELRLVPPVIGIPKSSIGDGDHSLTIEGKACRVPDNIQITLATSVSHRNPKYWPHSKPTLPGGKPVHPLSNLDNDLEEFRPQRWLLSEDTSIQNGGANGHAAENMPTESIGGGELGINESADTSEKLYKPIRGAYYPFSEGYRSCLGRRFAQVEILAVLAIIFQNYSVELDTKEYATDAELAKMDADELAEVWQKTAEDARELMLNGMGTVITLQLRKGHVKLRLLPRGKERFPDNVDDVWKQNHPERIVQNGNSNWRPWAGDKVHGI